MASRLLLLALPIVILLAGIELRLRRMTNTFSVKQDTLERRAFGTDVLVLGNSQAAYGIDPSMMSSAATNAAGFSQSLRCDEWLAMRYLDRMPRLQLVILSLSYSSLRYRLELHEPWREFFYRNYFGVPEETPRAIRWQPRDFLFLANYGNRAVLEFASNGFSQRLAIDERGWLPTDPNACGATSLSDSEGLARVRQHEAAMRSDAAAANTQLLRRFVGTLRGRGIRVALVTTPVFPTYLQHMENAVYRELTGTAEQIAAEQGALFKDYLADNRFVRSDFQDTDHLCVEGARKFSRLLAEETGFKQSP